MRPYLIASAVLLSGQFGFAQMTYDYSAYETHSYDASHIYATAVVDGSATCSNIHIQSLNCSAVTHQGQAYVNLAGTGGWVYGPEVNPNDYISVSNAQSINATAGDYTLSAEGTVLCSVAGLVFIDSFPVLSFSVGASETLYANATDTKTSCSWNKSCPAGQTATCGVGTIYGTPPCANFVELYFVWYNFGAGNVCLQSGPAVGSTVPVGGCD